MSTPETDPEIFAENGSHECDIPLDVFLAANAPQFNAPSPEIILRAERAKKDIERAFISDLGAQFEQTHHIKTGEELMEYTVVSPGAGSKEANEPEWAVFIGGLGAVKETYKKEMLDLALSGKRALFVAPGKGMTYQNEGDANYFDAVSPKLPDTIRNKAYAIAYLLEQLGITNANIIGHSQGGAVAAALAGMRKDLAKRLILDNTAGLIGEDTTKELVARAAKEVAQESDISQPLNAWWRQAAHLFRHPVENAKDVHGLAHTDILGILDHIQDDKIKTGKGPEVFWITSYSDKIFPAEKSADYLGDNPFQRIDRAVIRRDKKAGHQIIGRDGAELVISMMDDDSNTAHSIVHQIITESEAEPELRKAA